MPLSPISPVRPAGDPLTDDAAKPDAIPTVGVPVVTSHRRKRGHSAIAAHDHRAARATSRKPGATQHPPPNRRVPSAISHDEPEATAAVPPKHGVRPVVTSRRKPGHGTNATRGLRAGRATPSVGERASVVKPTNRRVPEQATVAPSPIPVVPVSDPLSDALGNMTSLSRSRGHFVSAKCAVQNQIKAIQRGVHARMGCDKAKHATCPGVYDIETPDIVVLREAALVPLEKNAKARLKAMLAECGALPARVLAWADEVRGFGRPSLAQIVAEAGNLDSYANPAKLWSRMGLGLGPDREVRYQGRSPRRRAVMAVIGGNFLKSGGEYKGLYDDRKAYELTKPACLACPGEHCRPGHAHNRALRYIEKRLLLNLWRVWRGLEPKSKADDAGADGAPPIREMPHVAATA